MPDIKQLKALLERADSLITKYPDSKTRIDMSLLKILAKNSPQHSDDEKFITEPMKRKLRKDTRLFHIQIVIDLINAGWPPVRLIEALRNYFPDKKYIIELLIFALIKTDHSLLTQDLRDLKKMIPKKNPNNFKGIKRICEQIAKALTEAKWASDETAALLLKFFEGNIVVESLSLADWDDNKIVMAISETKTSNQMLLLFLDKANWDDARIVRALNANNWSTYNILVLILDWLKWNDVRLLKALRKNDWKAQRVCTGLLSIRLWNPIRIFAAFVKVKVKMETISLVAKLIAQQGPLVEDDIQKILGSSKYTPSQIEQILTESKKGILFWEELDAKLIQTVNK